jgi:hypothetical protein
MSTAPRSRLRFSPWLLLGLVLVAAICVQLYSRANTERYGGLNPAPLYALKGWTVEQLPLTRSQLEQEMTERLLLYDDALHVNATNGRVTAQVLVFGWKPRKISPERILAHTPDVCWVTNGMTIDEIIRELQLPGRLPAEYRQFSTGDGQKLHVLFWPLYGGAPSPALRDSLAVEGFGARLAYHARMWLALSFGMSRVQHYVRVTTTVPPDEFLRRGGEELLAAAFAATVPPPESKEVAR